MLIVRNKIAELSKRSSLIWGVGFTFVIQTIGIGLSYGSHILFARWLGPSEYGNYTYVMSWGIVLATLARLGFPTAVLRFIPQYEAKKQWGYIRGLIRTSWWIVFVAGVGLSLAGTIVIRMLDASIGYAYTEYMLIGIWLIPLLALERLQLELARGINKTGLAYLPSVIIRPILLIGGVFYLTQIKQLSTSPFVIWTLILVLIIVLSSQLSIFLKSLSLNFHAAAATYQGDEWRRMCWPLLISSSALILMNQADILLIGSLLSSREVAFYNSATKLAGFSGFFLVAVNMAIAPKIASYYTNKNLLGLQKMIRTAAHLSFWPSLAVTLLLVINGDFLLALFGPDFVIARAELSILAFANLISTAAGPVGYLMILTGYQVQAVRVYAITALVHILLNATGISFLGTLGAAIATSISMILWNLWLYMLVVKKLGIRPSIIDAVLSEIRD